MTRSINVVGAVIVRDGAVLCARRGPDGALPGMWEFPGGKIESGESAVAALSREIEEELGCSVAVGEMVESTTHEYEFAMITLTTFYCTLADGAPGRTEHSELRWMRPEDLLGLEWAPADVPAVETVRRQLASSVS